MLRTIMKKKFAVIPPPTVESSIRTIRGQRVILDANLAAIYGVTTKQLNQAVKRNRDKFPEDFAFLLTAEEVRGNRSQIVTGSGKHRDQRFPPVVFTEHGAIMAANVLNSPQATQMSIFVVRAFIKMRSALVETGELARKLADIEKKLTARIDNCDQAIVDVLQQIMRMLNPPPPPPDPPPKKIGYSVRESRATYRVRRELCPI
jgi:hypothetical protein